MTRVFKEELLNGDNSPSCINFLAVSHQVINLEVDYSRKVITGLFKLLDTRAGKLVKDWINNNPINEHGIKPGFRGTLYQDGNYIIPVSFDITIPVQYIPNNLSITDCSVKV